MLHKNCLWENHMLWINELNSTTKLKKPYSMATLIITDVISQEFKVIRIWILYKNIILYIRIFLIQYEFFRVCLHGKFTAIVFFCYSSIEIILPANAYFRIGTMRGSYKYSGMVMIVLFPIDFPGLIFDAEHNFYNRFAKTQRLWLTRIRLHSWETEQNSSSLIITVSAYT